MRTGIDWKNHLIAFIATLIGIIVGLNLDERQKEKETSNRLADFKNLINSEIDLNISRLDTFLNNSNKHELHLRFLITKEIDKNVIKCSQHELDSLAMVWFPSPFIINTVKLSEQKYRVYFALSTFDFVSQNTVWQAFKSTDLINHLKADEITKYTRVYQSFEHLEKSINSRKDKLVYLIDNRQTESTLSKLTLKEYLSRLVDLMFQDNVTVDQGLIELKAEFGDTHSSKYPGINDIELVKMTKQTIK